MMTLSRRNLIALGAGSALVPCAPGLRVAMGATPGTKNNVLVFLYLRGGMDGLQMVAPADDGNYHDNRPTIGVRSDGLTAGYNVGALDGTQFFIHPLAGRLKTLFDQKSLAIIHAVGVPTDSRSHFEAQALVDKGMASHEQEMGNGWLARHITIRPGPLGDFAATTDVSTGSSALVGVPGLIPTTGLEYLPNTLLPERAALITALNSGTAPSAVSARNTVKLLDTVREKSKNLPPDPGGNGSYSFNALSQNMKSLAHVLKFDLGVEAAIVDNTGVWDTHENIPQYFSNAARELSTALYAFTQDVGPEVMSRVTIVAMTEFGRRVEENSNGGTDHGSASTMMVLGAGVNGGKIYGQWPGLASKNLNGGDLAVTTDYRQVLAEVLVKRMGQSAIDQIFPTIKYAPLGLAR